MAQTEVQKLKAQLAAMEAEKAALLSPAAPVTPLTLTAAIVAAITIVRLIPNGITGTNDGLHVRGFNAAGEVVNVYTMDADSNSAFYVLATKEEKDAAKVARVTARETKAAEREVARKARLARFGIA